MRRFTLLPSLLTLPFLAATIMADPPEPKKPAERALVQLTPEALQLHREAIVIDGHNDLAWQFRKLDDFAFQKLDIARPQKTLHTDIPRLRQGGVGAQFWAAYVEADKYKGADAIKATLEQIDVIHRFVRAYPDTFAMAYTVDDILRIHKAGKIASLIGLEGGHSIDNSIPVLRAYYTLGVRYMTLTHSETLDWADAATDTARHNGLTEFGEQVVLEMNRLGMMVDISHVSAATMKHAIRVSKAPVIASHSSAYALAPHPRNVPDDVLKLITQTNGIVMVNFYPGFIVPEGARASKNLFQISREYRAKYPNDKDYRAAMEQYDRENPFPVGSIHTLVDHIDHIVKEAGVDCVGLGSDYDGITKVPKQLEDVSCYPYITQELLNRGYSREQIHKILGGNLLRVFRQVEQVAADSRK